METSVLLGILAFAGVLIGVLAGSRGQKLLDRRNHHDADGNPGKGGNPGPIYIQANGMREQLKAMTNEMKGIRGELQGIRTGQGKVLDALGVTSAELAVIKDRLPRRAGR